MELHHIVIRVPEARIAAWDAHVAAAFPSFRAPSGFALAIARDVETPGLYHLTSVLADRDRNFRAVRAAGGGDLLLHPLLERFGAEIVRRDRGAVVGLATPRWTHPRPTVDERRIGQARVALIHDADDLWIPRWQVPDVEWRRAMPEADAAGEMVFEMTVGLVRLGAAVVLVDLGFGAAPERYTERPPFWRSPGLIAGLAELGVSPADVTHVVITHTHGDHIMGATDPVTGAPTLPRARYLLGRADWVASPAPEWAASSVMDELRAIERAGMLDLLDGDHQIAPGIDVLAAPGESPGHSILRVRSDGQSFYHLGDLFHHTAEVEHLDWLPDGRDPAASGVSRRRAVDAAIGEGALLTFTHQPFPGWGRIVRDGDGQRWESV